MGATRTVERGETFSGYHELEVLACPSCGVLYGAPKRLIDDRRDHPDRNVWCPNGHSIHWPGPTEADRLRESLRRARDVTAAERARREQAEAHASAMKGQATRARNERDRLQHRAAAGVCPCCTRSFKQLRRHMRSQHPDFLEDGS